MDASQKADLLSFIHDDGKGFIGVHSATITFTEWPEYGEMIGGYFDEHPWGTFDAPLIVEDPAFQECSSGRAHSCCGTKSTSCATIPANKVRVLMRLDPSKLDLSNPKVHRTDRDFAVTWVRAYGKGASTNQTSGT